MMRAALPPGGLVAVIGAGAMGAGIAQVALLAGHPVCLHDARPGAAEAAVAALGDTIARQVDKGRLTPEAAAAARARLTPARALDDLAGAALAIEAIVEDADAKCRLLAELENRLSPAAILASNTSSIPITLLGAALRQPQRLVGLHFFNPAPQMPLVEIVAGLDTDPELLDGLEATARAWGKTPVRTRSTPGFIVNRVARPFYGEALRLLHERAADCATLDAVLRDAGGFRMGPFELMDLIGLDVNLAVTRSVWQAYGFDARYTPSPIQSELVAAGRLGRKSGHGFYRWDDRPRPAAVTAPDCARPRRIRLFGDTPPVAALAERLRAAGHDFETSAATPDERIAQADSTAIYLTDGRTASERAADSGEPDSVVLDLALDYRSTPRLALAAAARCAPSAFDRVCGLLQAAGIAATPIDDVPALVVMRTVAMLANEAADAVHQGVAAPADVDTAMRLGTNYPRGPLAWADAIGLPWIHRVLGHLARTTGDPRYRLSPRLLHHLYSGKPLHEPT